MGTSSCIIAYKPANGHVKIIQNSEGSNSTPSIISFKKNDDILVGEPAKKLGIKQPERTFYDAQRMIGRNFDDPLVQEEMRQW